MRIMDTTGTLETPNGLGFAKPPAATRVAVAMSGGVDSSVVAAMMKDDGFDVVSTSFSLAVAPRP